MGDDQDGARIVAQMMLEPVDAFGVEMVGGLVEQQQVGLAQQQLGQRHAALFAAREIVDRGLARRAAHGIHRLLDLRFEVPQVLRVDHVLQLARLLGILVVIVRHQRIVLVEDRLLGGHPFHDIAHHIEGGIELRLLLEIAAGGALRQPGLAVPLLVDPRHDPQQRRFARAVGAEHADLGVRDRMTGGRYRAPSCRRHRTSKGPAYDR